jgi:cation:H+ antiporter
MEDFLILIISSVGLLVSGEFLVRSSSRIAYSLGVSSLVIGLTVVSFGTSAPELFISVNSALKGHGDIAVGNIIGSNIANTLLILGLCAFVSPLFVPSQLLRRELPIMFFVSVIFYYLAQDGLVDRSDGLLLCFLLFLFISRFLHLNSFK